MPDKEYPNEYLEWQRDEREKDKKKEDENEKMGL